MSNLVSLIHEIQDYSFNYDNIERLSTMIIANDIKNNMKKNKENPQTNYMSSDKSLFTPQYNDKLFWIFYIITKGIDQYNIIGKKHFFIEQNEKIKQIENIRENKHILKKYKWQKSKIEPNLMGDKKINLSTFFCLCRINNINLCLINNKCLYDCVSESYDAKIYIIEKNNNEYSINLVEINLEEYKKIKEKYWVIDNLVKPLRAISSYKVNDLINICKKLDICIYKTVNDTKKVFNKKELYAVLSENI